MKLCFRKSSSYEKKGRLYYQIIIHRKVHQYSSDFYISETEWNNEKGILIDCPTSQRSIELTIIRKRVKWDMHKISEIAYRMLEDNELLIYENIMREFEEQRQLQSFTSFMQGQVLRLEKVGRIRTSETYNSTFKSFMRFRHNIDLYLYEIDESMIEDYEAFLHLNRLTLNSISFYMRTLRTMLNKAVKQSLIISCNFFDNVYTGIGETTRRAIRIDDIRRIKLLNLATCPQLDFARDMFLLSLYFRGMSFVDMANLKHDNLQNGYLMAQ